VTRKAAARGASTAHASTAHAPTALALAALLGLIPALAPSLLVGGEAPEENQDLLFARALVDRGWAVVAEPVIDRGIAATGSAAKDKARFQVLRGMLFVQVAKRAQAAAREEAFKEAFKEIDALLKTSVRPDAREGQDLGEFFVDAAVVVANAARDEATPEKAAGFRKRAETMIDQAEKIFRARLEKAQATPAAGSSEASEDEGSEQVTQATEDELNAAFNLAHTIMRKGMIQDDKEKKKTAFTLAIRHLEDFQATYAGALLAYQAANLTGQCYNELEQYGNAMTAFEGAIALVDVFRERPGAKPVIDHPIAAEIIQQGFFYKAQAANKAGKHEESFKTAAAAMNTFPASFRKKPIGLAIRIEGARAQFKMGKDQEARQKLDEVIRDDPDGPMGAEARLLLGEMVGAADIGGDVVSALQGFFERGEYLRLIGTCRSVLARSDGLSDKARAEKAPPVLLWLGKGYSAMRRNREAAIAFEEILANFPDYKEAPEAAFQAVKARLLANVSSPSALDKARYDENLKTLVTKYPKSSQAAAGKYLEADALVEADKFEEAAKMYLSVPEAAGKLHDNAVYQAGLAYWSLAVRSKTYKDAKPWYEQGEKIFKDVIADASKNEAGVDRDRLDNRLKLRAAARVKLADTYASYSLKKYKEALEVIEACDAEDKPSPEDIVFLTQSRVRANAALDDVEKAEAAMNLLKERAPDFGMIPTLCREIARAYDRKATAAEKSGATDQYKALITKAIDFYSQWYSEYERIYGRPPAASPALKAISERALAIALEVTGLPAGKDSFSDCIGKTDIPQEEWKHAALLLNAARGKDIDWLGIARIGRAYGFMGDWKKCRGLLEDALVRGGLIPAIGLASPKPKFEALQRNPELIDFFIDLGYAELIPASRGGTTRARNIFAAAFEVIGGQRETGPWWKCRYGSLASHVKDGDYDKARGQLNILKQAFPQWDGGTFGLKGPFEALEKELESKQPGKVTPAEPDAEGAEKPAEKE
jgi:tetratricopeptide (TPR) repeat protein